LGGSSSRWNIKDIASLIFAIFKISIVTHCNLCVPPMEWDSNQNDLKHNVNISQKKIKIQFINDFYKYYTIFHVVPKMHHKMFL